MPISEQARLEILRQQDLLDSPEEEAFDAVVRLAARFFRAPIVLVSLVDEARAWFKARVGLAQTEVPREWSFCSAAIAADRPLVVPDLSADPRFAANPLVRGEGLRFYCGVPIRSTRGAPLGTLCLMDRQARAMPPEALADLQTLALLVESHLELRRSLRQLEAGLAHAREDVARRELVTAMIVHDLRGPLTSIEAIASMIEPRDDDSRELLLDLAAESGRMRMLLADLLDLSRARAGVPPPLATDTVFLDLLARNVQARMARVAARRDQQLVVAPATGRAAVAGDERQLDRVLWNLVANAIQHGPAGQPITIAATPLPAGGARCSVEDLGRPIPEEARERVFAAFDQLTAAGGERPVGHGLGLAFCRMSIAAQGGRIWVEPGSAGGNRFVLELPGPAPG